MEPADAANMSGAGENEKLMAQLGLARQRAGARQQAARIAFAPGPAGASGIAFAISATLRRLPRRTWNTFFKGNP
jgi:hypothetical protein